MIVDLPRTAKKKKTLHTSRYIGSEALSSDPPRKMYAVYDTTYPIQ